MYSIVINNKTILEGLETKITLTESIDSIAYTANVDLAIPEKIYSKVKIEKANIIEIIEKEKKESIFKGVIWDINQTEKFSKNISLQCKERTIYLEESEDEYLFNAGTTASGRARKLCKDWGIPIGKFEDTKTKLSKSPPKIGSIYGMMLDDLKETAQKGGGLFKYQMKNKLDLIKLGSNKKVYDLTDVVEKISSQDSLSGAVTKVKVLGKKDDNKKSPVMGVYSKNSKKLGTIQKVIQDEKIKNKSIAKSRADALFSSGDYGISVDAIDIPGIRAGDKVKLRGTYLYVSDVTHNLGEPGKMQLNLDTLSQIRRKFYVRSQ